MRRSFVLAVFLCLATLAASDSEHEYYDQAFIDREQFRALALYIDFYEEIQWAESVSKDTERGAVIHDMMRRFDDGRDTACYCSDSECHNKSKPFNEADASNLCSYFATRPIRNRLQELDFQYFAMVLACHIQHHVKGPLTTFTGLGFMLWRDAYLDDALAYLHKTYNSSVEDPGFNKYCITDTQSVYSCPYTPFLKKFTNVTLDCSFALPASS